MQRMALSSGGSGGRSPISQRSMSSVSTDEACGSLNGAPDK